MRSFESFYRDEFRTVVAMAIAFTSDTRAAEDIAQEAFVAAHRRWDRVSQYDSPRAWVRRVMINKATSLRRRWEAERRAVERAGPAEHVEPDLSIETTGVWDRVRRLPKRQQQAVVLHYVGHLTTNEMANVMGCSVGAVKTHLHRARETLKKTLAAFEKEIS